MMFDLERYYDVYNFGQVVGESITLNYLIVW